MPLQARAMVSISRRRSALMRFFSRWRLTRNWLSVTRRMKNYFTCCLANQPPPSSSAASSQNAGAMPNAALMPPEMIGMSVWLPLRTEVRRPTASPWRPGGDDHPLLQALDHVRHGEPHGEGGEREGREDEADGRRAEAERGAVERHQEGVEVPAHRERRADDEGAAQRRDLQQVEDARIGRRRALPQRPRQGPL